MLYGTCGEDSVSTRREFLSSIPAIWFPVAQAKAEDDRVEALINELASALEHRHGGRWTIGRDDKQRYLLFARH